MDGDRPKDGSIVQIGLVIVPPAAGATIDNYALWYYTSDAKLAHQLIKAGFAAQHRADHRIHGHSKRDEAARRNGEKARRPRAVVDRIGCSVVHPRGLLSRQLVEQGEQRCG